MPNAPVTIYDRDINPVADLKNAYRIGYDKRLNRVWTARFQLPVDDSHYSEVQGRRYAEIYDDEERVGLFRIENPRDDHDETQFRCRHVLTTLLDSQLIGNHSGIIGTSAAIDYVLSQQSNWTKGTVDFSRNFHHEWEDITLLEALLSIPDRYNEDYQWTFDTTSYPWTLNLGTGSTETAGLIYYEENAETIERRMDFSELINKLYAYGNGSGADQVSIADSSYTSNEYVDDTTSQDDYGTVKRVWVDQRYTDADNLYEAAEARLNRHKDPRIEYRADAVDLYRKFETNKFELGKKVTVRDQKRGIEVDARVERVKKNDVTGKPSDIKLEIANQSEPYPEFGRVAYADNLDQVKEGAQYSKVYSTQIDSGEILLSAIKGGATPTMPATPDTAGLYLGADHMGYHNGSSWTTYMDLNGQLRLEGTNGYLHWDPSTESLDIKGSMAIEGGDPIGTPATSGLYFGSDIMGFYDGSNWSAYIDETGGFKFQGDSANYIEWDGSTLTIKGQLDASDLTTGTLDFNQISKSGLEVLTSELADSAVTGAKISSSTTITAGSGDDVAVLDGADDTWRIYAGDSNPDVAPFRVSQNGLCVANAFHRLETSSETVVGDDIFRGAKLIEMDLVGSSGRVEGDHRGCFAEGCPGTVTVWTSKGVTVPNGKRWILSAVAADKNLEIGSGEQGAWEGTSSGGVTSFWKDSGGDYHHELGAGSYTLDLYCNTINALYAGLAKNDLYVYGELVYQIWEIPA